MATQGLSNEILEANRGYRKDKAALEENRRKSFQGVLHNVSKEKYPLPY